MSLTPRTTLLLVLSVATPVRAATYVVNSTGDEGDAVPLDRTCQTTTPGECTLRAAIEEANAHHGADRIVLPPGVFPGGHLILNRVHVVGAGPESTFIDGGGAGPVILVGHRQSAGLFDLTVTNGHSESEAGGVHSRGALSLVNVNVTRCSGGTGGVHSQGLLIMTDCVIEHCSGLAGGALRATSATTGNIDGCVFRDNTHVAFHVDTSPGLPAPIRVRDCTFERNGTLGKGGALSVARGWLVVESTTMTENEGVLGGAVHVEQHVDAILTMTNCTISGNTADRDGGGLNAMGSSSVIVRSTTIVDNRARRGGGVAMGDSIQLEDVILFGNEAIDGPDCAGRLHGRGNLIGDVSSCDPNSGVVITSDDPLLGPLANNGGQTLTHALQPGSPAIDAGQFPGLLHDQRSSRRPSGPAPDLGAYELDQTADTDGDGVLDITDNCTHVANESQVDADGDGWGDACDCAPAGPDSHALPGAVTLLVTRAADGIELRWTDVSPLAGPAVLHDIASDTIGSLRERGTADASCVESAWMGTSWLDAEADAVRDVYYIVRASNACGPGHDEGWGRDSRGHERPPCS